MGLSLGSGERPGGGLAREPVGRHRLAAAGFARPRDDDQRPAQHLGRAVEPALYESGGFVLDDGLMKQNFNNRFNMRTRLDAELSKYVSVGTNISLAYTKSQRPTNNYVDFMRFPQWIPARHNEFTSELTGYPVGSYAQPSHFNTGTAIYPVGEVDPETGEPTLVKANSSRRCAPPRRSRCSTTTARS